MPLGLLLSLVLSAAPSRAQAPERPPEARLEVRAVRLAAPVVVDGRLDEEVWTSAPAVATFLQREPTEGAPATERTEVRIAYDDEALYVGARMHDGAPKDIVARLSRRDTFDNSDRFFLYLDPYQDRRSGFYFSVDAAGTLTDGVLYNDDWDDSAWDGVWEARAAVDEQGWTAEMRIPYSQLRFHRADSYRWGVNARRKIARKNEDAYLVFTPKKSSGFVSRFPDLVGIEGVHPPRRLSVAPYSTVKAEYARPGEGDPFRDGSRLGSALGADLKMGLGSNLTLDATVNPDFGQVEVDPAVVNLSDVETFFPEKRPFFLEGSNTFNFGSGGATNTINFNWWSPSFFYSRRIGRAPQGSVDDADFVDVPAGATILGAGKLTGKLGERWNLGTLHALTGREEARVYRAGLLSRDEVEPFTYYGVFRAQRDFPQNRHGLGVIGTVVSRRLGEGRLRDRMSGDALVVGLDGWTFLDASKTWVLTGWTGLSRVAGTASQIQALQESPQRYLQRPDREHVLFDPAATSLTGTAGRFALNKEKGNFLVNAAFGFMSPGFEVNDLGIFGRADLLNGHFWVRRRWTDTGRLTRWAALDGAVFRSYDFEGNKTTDGVFVWGGATLKSYHSINAWFAYNPDTLSWTRTRGGPLTLSPAGWEADLSGGSDDRRRLVLNAGWHASGSPRGDSHYSSLRIEGQWRPRSNILLSAGPSIEWNRDGAQWVTGIDDPLATATFGHRYVFAVLDQRTFSGSLRLNWTFTPRLSLQLYVQPLISSGAYTRYGELARPKSYEFFRYGQGGSTISATGQVDPDGPGPAAPFEIGRPDFDVRSLRGNAVLRWEYRPGSTAYLVWTQSRSEVDEIGRFQLGRSLSRLVNAPADNIFLVKLTYWWGR